MLNKIKLITAVLFLGTSLASAETYNEFRAKNGMDSKGKTVKSSTSAQFQRATPQNSEIAKVIDGATQISGFKKAKKKLTLQDIRVSKFTEKDDDKFTSLVNMYDFKLFYNSVGNEEISIENIDEVNGKLQKNNTGMMIALKKHCLSHGQRSEYEIDRAVAVFKSYKLTISPINEQKVLLYETTTKRGCILKYKN